MINFNKGLLGKVSLVSLFIFFLSFMLFFLNVSRASPLVYSFERIFVCEECQNSNVPSDTLLTVIINVDVVHFKDENFNIKLIDVVPSDWNIINSNGGKINEFDYYKTIEWDIDLSENKKKDEFDEYDVLEVSKEYSVKSPSVDINKIYNFISKLEKEEIDSTEVTVFKSSMGETSEEVKKIFSDNEERVIKPFASGESYLKRLIKKYDSSRKVYTDIPEELSKEDYIIKLYHIKNGLRIDVTDDIDYNVSFVDSDNDNIIDGIQWDAPQNSEEIFEIEAYIKIINVQSYPTVGGNWTVRFTTKGMADLIITAIDGTTFGEKYPDDLKFLELKCGENVLNPILNGNSIVYKNYYCDETGYEISKVLTSGKHGLEFEFGEQRAYASNDADMFETGFIDTDGWTTVNLIRSYTCPVVVASPRQGFEVSADMEVATAVITNVTSNSFKVQLYNETNGAIAGNVSYIVVENGTHVLSNGMLLQAGLVTGVNEYNANGDGGTAYESITFWTAYDSLPTVIASPQNDSAQDWVSVRWQSLTTSGISLSLEIDQTYGSGPISASTVGSGNDNTIAWIAMNRTNATDMEGNIELDVDNDPGATGGWQALTFNNTYTEPIFFAIIEEGGGTDPTTVGRQNLTGTGIDIRQTEERTDGEQDHNDLEDDLWMVFESGNSPPATPTNIQCDGSNNCNITVNTGVYVNSSGSIDADGDNITYYIEVSLINTTESGDQESGEISFIGTQTSIDYNSTITDLNPEARWLLNGDGSDSADGHYDSGGTLPSFVSSIIPNPPTSNCGDFDGNDDELHIPDAPEINSGSGYLGTERAISVWIVADSIDASGNGRGIWTEGGTGNSLNMYVFDNGTSDNIYCNAVESSGTYNDWVSYTISTGSLYHVGCMFDFAGGSINMYINGTLVDSDTSLAVGAALSSHGNNNALGGVDQDTISHSGAQISGNFDGRIADLVYWSDGSVITQENFTAIYEAGTNIEGETDIDATKDWVTYSNILDCDWKNITEINVTVNVTVYDNLGSGLNGNAYPDLQLEMATSDGGGWKEVGNFSIDGTGNKTLTTTDSTILNAWLDASVSDLRIRGVNFDYNDPSNYDKINYTGVWVTVDGISWLEIGNHTNETQLYWNTTDIEEQTCIDIRSRAIDINGSNSYSSYFTKNSCLNISHADSSPPTWHNNLTSVNSGSQYVKNRQYQFNVTWNDSETDVSFVLIEHNFSGGSPVNATVTTHDGDVYYYTVNDLAAGTYVWKEYANNSDGFWNVTNGGQEWVYEIEKNTSTEDFMNLTLGIESLGTESNYQHTYPATTNSTGWYSFLEGQDITFTLYRNDTIIGTDNPEEDLIELGAGFYVYTYNTSGNENYTSASKNFNLTIQQNQTNPVSIYFVNSTGGYADQNMTVSYEKQTNASGYTVYSNAGIVYLFRDSLNVTDTEYNQWVTLGANTNGYAYKINTSGNENYTYNNSGSTYYIIVNKKQTTINLWINGTLQDYGVTQNDYVNFTVQLVGYPGRNVELWTNYSDGVWKLWDSGPSPYQNITQMAVLGKFEFKGNYSGDDNYTYSEEFSTVTVSALSMDSKIEYMSPLSINQSQNSTVVGNCSCGGGTCNNVYIEIQFGSYPIPSEYGSELQVNGSSSYSLGTLANSWATRSWNITGWIPGTYEIKIKCNSTDAGNFFSDIKNLEVNDTENPTWSGNSTFHASGIKYSQGRQYQFNVTWNDNKAIDKVLIEHNFSGGSPVNATVTTHDGDVYYYTVNDLAAGTYVWKEYANDTTGNKNSTDTWIFVVDKAATKVTLYLNGSTTNKTSKYPNSTINVTAVSNVSNLYVQIWRNGTLIANTTNSATDIKSWPAWNNNFTAQVLGNNNYTHSSPVTLWWNISKGDVPLVLESNVSWSESYPTATNITGSGCPSQITCYLYRNDTQLPTNKDALLLGAGYYNYTYNLSESQNYSANTTSNMLEILRGSVQPSLTINTTWTETYPEATNVSCSVSSLNDEVSCTLYRNDTGLVGNPDENLLGGGSYEYIANTTETANYSSNSTGDVRILIIEPYPFTDIDLFLNGSQSNYNMNFDEYLNVTAILESPSIGNMEIWTNYSDGVWKIWDSCIDCSYLENVTLMTDSGFWNFSANYSGNQNYSPSYESWYVKVADIIAPTFSDNSTNSTEADSWVEHRLKWEDNVDVSGYVFRFCNGTWNGSHCLGGPGMGLNYNDTIMGLNPTYRWLLDGDETDSIDAAHSDAGNDPDWVENIIPNNDTVQCGDYTGSDSTNLPDRDDINLQITYNKSISVWIIADTIDTSGNGSIIWEEGGATNSMALYVLNDGGRDQIFFSVVEGTSYDYVNFSLDEGGLAHIGVSLDCTNQEMYLYINGSLVDSKTGGLNIGNSFAAHGDDPSIGGLDNAADRHDGASLSGGFDGRISDLVYWAEPTKVLNETDFDNIYQAGVDEDLEIWQADVWQPFSVSSGWSNVTKFVNSTNGSVIAWCVYANDSSNNWNYSSCDDPFYYTAQITYGYMEVELVLPPGNTLVEQYGNFVVNATVYCRDGRCGDVYGTVRYNMSSANPNTPVNTTYGELPFFVDESPANALKECPLNKLDEDEYCNITWNINSTGSINSAWKIGVLFNSSYVPVVDNNTENITVTIVPCIEEMTIHFSKIVFGNLLPSSVGNAATGNPINEYNVSNSGTCVSNIWIKATNLTKGNGYIPFYNISFNNVTDDYPSSYTIADVFSSQNSSFKKDVASSTNTTGYYFLGVPPTYAGNYTGNLTFCLNSSLMGSLCV